MSPPMREGLSRDPADVAEQKLLVPAVAEYSTVPSLELNTAFYSLSLTQVYKTLCETLHTI